MCLKEKIHVLDMLHSGMSLVLLAMNSILMNQPYMLNKVSLNRNTHKIRLCVDWFTKILCLDAHRNVILCFP